MQCVAADVAKPQFTFYFDALEKRPSRRRKLTVISNLEASEFYVFAGMASRLPWKQWKMARQQKSSFMKAPMLRMSSSRAS